MRGLDVKLAATPGTIGFAFFLAMMTGTVDAVIFLRCGLLPSVMTANVVFLSVHAMQGAWSTVWLAAVAFASYLLGSVLAARVAVHSDPPTMRHRLAVIEASLLGAVAVLGALELAAWHVLDPSRAHFVIVALASVAMAVQTPQVRSVENAPISTTFVTGALSVLGYGLATSRDDHTVLRKDRIILIVIAAYALGGLLGGGATIYFPGSGLVAPILLFGLGWGWYLMRRGKSA